MLEKENQTKVHRKKNHRFQRKSVILAQIMMEKLTQGSTFPESHDPAAAAVIGSSSLIGGGVVKSDSGL